MRENIQLMASSQSTLAISTACCISSYQSTADGSLVSYRQTHSTKYRHSSTIHRRVYTDTQEHKNTDRQVYTGTLDHTNRQLCTHKNTYTGLLLPQVVSSSLSTDDTSESSVYEQTPSNHTRIWAMSKPPSQDDLLTETGSNCVTFYY